MGLRRALVPLHPYSDAILTPWVWEHDLIGRHLLNGKMWDEPVIAFMQSYIKPGSMFIDVGAHVGFYSLASLHLGAMCAAAYEPFLYQILQVNCAGLPITAVGHAVGERRKHAKWRPTRHAEFEGGYPDPLSVHGLGGLGGLSLGEYDPLHDDARDSVMVLTLDSEADLYGWNRNGVPISFLKIDAQGWDLEVMVGARNLITAHRPVITFEFEEDLSKNPFEDYASFLTARNYSVGRINSLPNDYIAIPRP